jgi:hypothetical protein
MSLDKLLPGHPFKRDQTLEIPKMSNTPLNGLVMRTAIVRRAGLGYIYAADPKKEANGTPHTIIFKYKDGNFERGDSNYDANAVCAISKPQPGLVDVSGAGFFTVNAAAGVSTADIFNTSSPAPAQARTGGIRNIAEIAGQAFAIGLRGMVYRLDGLKAWTRIDEGIPPTFDGQAIHGFASEDLYAAGRDGQLWHFNGVHWKAEDSPTSETLTCITCAPNGLVYAAGHRGTLLEGRAGDWRVIDTRQYEENIWDIEWFNGQLYFSTMTNVFTLTPGGPAPIDFGEDRPKSCYQLSTAAGILWSNGEFDLMSFDGSRWTRIV